MRTFIDACAIGAPMTICAWLAIGFHKGAIANIQRGRLTHAHRCRTFSICFGVGAIALSWELAKLVVSSNGS